ncbi:MAG TPA: hypothetical protein PK431_06610 [Chitinophagales bacterium]|nr:hypothetical protein [Chitinophagales bacterium]
MENKIIKNDAETMPIPPFTDGSPTKLIIGTFPPHIDKWDYKFFFPNHVNRIWRTLGKVAYDECYELLHNNDEEAVNERKQILLKLNSAMVNIIYSCKRNEKKSALDNDLEIVGELHNIIDEILRPYQNITSIYLTSSSGKNSCVSLLKKHLNEHGINLNTKSSEKDRAGKIANPLIDTIEFEGRKIKVYSLFSPSPTAQRRGITEDILLQQYKIIQS